MLKRDTFELVELTDDMMGISVDVMPDRMVRCREREKFVNNIEFPFPVGLFTYERHGTLGKWQVVFRMDMGQDKCHPDFVGACINATRDAPTYLSRRQTKDAIDAIARTTGKTKRFCTAIVSAVLPDGTLPTFCSPKEETKFLETVTKLVLCMDGAEEAALIEDMRVHNIRGNTTISMFEPFWECCARVLELENGSGAHHRRKAASDTDTTVNVSYAPGILSISQLVRVTVETLEKENKVRGVDFKVPSEMWVAMQLSPNNEFASTAAYYTGRLPFIRKLISRTGRDDSHPAAHWNAGMNDLLQLLLLLSLDIKTNKTNTSNTLLFFVCQYCAFRYEEELARSLLSFVGYHDTISCPAGCR